ncbi:MAG: hypothetical protein RIA64_04800 [Rhodospirillales bacterium]
MKFVIGIATIISFCFVTSLAKADQWKYFSSSDEMTGELNAFATSPSTPPTKPLVFPYHDVKGWLGFGCNHKREWAYIGFNIAPNLVDTKAQSGGYSTFSTRIRWDDDVQDVRMEQEWGSRFLQFQNDAAAIARMTKGQSVLLELRWHGSERTYFRFTLGGSAEAIKNARAGCQN